jgi:hypothetical protein
VVRGSRSPHARVTPRHRFRDLGHTCCPIRLPLWRASGQPQRWPPRIWLKDTRFAAVLAGCAPRARSFARCALARPGTGPLAQPKTASIREVPGAVGKGPADRPLSLGVGKLWRRCARTGTGRCSGLATARVALRSQRRDHRCPAGLMNVSAVSFQLEWLGSRRKRQGGDCGSRSNAQITMRESQMGPIAKRGDWVPGLVPIVEMHTGGRSFWALPRCNGRQRLLIAARVAGGSEWTSTLPRGADPAVDQVRKPVRASRDAGWLSGPSLSPACNPEPEGSCHHVS